MEVSCISVFVSIELVLSRINQPNWISWQPPIKQYWISSSETKTPLGGRTLRTLQGQSQPAERAKAHLYMLESKHPRRVQSRAVDTEH